MTLSIRKLNTKCHVARGSKGSGSLVEEAARGLLSSELSAQLGPSLDRASAVIRLQTLRVQLRIPAKNLTSFALATSWARAVALALHCALAGGPAVSLLRHESDAAYSAALLNHIATEGIGATWKYPELQALTGATPAPAIFEVLFAGHVAPADILVELSRRRSLELVLDLLDELALEQILQALAEGSSAQVELSFDQFIQLAYDAASPDGLHQRWSISSRRQAIRLWLETRRRYSVRSVWHSLRLLGKFLEFPTLLAARDSRLLQDRIAFPKWCEQIVTELTAIGGSSHSHSLGAESSVRSLESALASLRPLVPTATRLSLAYRVPIESSPKSRWIESDYAGLLLLLPIIRRLGLIRLSQKPELTRFGGMRAFSFLLAGMGSALLNRFSLSDSLEPAVSLFAGMMVDPDLTGMRQFFNSTDPGVISEFGVGSTWPEALDCVATKIAGAFALEVRGFRKASREAVFRQFLRIPGHVLIEESRLLIVLNSSPWAVALHISGFDDPLEDVGWLGHRRLEFVLEGL